jgi:ABC-type siderophore export system fused ATPase/permease subunit
MLTNEVTLNFYMLAAVLGISFFIGYAIRSKKMLKSRIKIQELEREILNNYEHILELEKEGLIIENRLQDIKSPVITMKAPGKELDLLSKKVPDINLRKELLSKRNIDRQSASGL